MGRFGEGLLNIHDGGVLTTEVGSLGSQGRGEWR